MRLTAPDRPFLAAELVPYSDHGQAPRRFEEIRQNCQIQGAKFQGVAAGRPADRAGAGGTAQSRDQSRRKRHRLLHRIAATAGQFLGSPLGRRGRRASRASLDARHQRRCGEARCVCHKSTTWGLPPSPTLPRKGGGSRAASAKYEQQRFSGGIATIVPSPARGGGPGWGLFHQARLRRIPAARICACQLRHVGQHSGARSGTGEATRLYHRGGRRRGAWRGRRATRWKRSASPPPPTRWRT